MQAPFVGREREIAMLTTAVDDTVEGRGRLVMLVGEPGIGKTRTATELARYAERRGAAVYWGRSYEGEGAPPYWIWVQPLRAIILQSTPEQLANELGRGAAEVTQIVPELRDKLPGIPAPSVVDSPEQAQFRLFDAVSTFLRQASARRPVLLVLDNLHAAPASSLLLLEFLSPELSASSLMLLGTYLDVELTRRHPLTLTLGELNRQQLFQRIALRRLPRAEVAAYVEAVVGAPPSSGLVDTLFAQTEGNPFFVSELVRLLGQEGALGGADGEVAVDWQSRIPEGIVEVIGRRLDRLSRDANRVLSLASVIGREFSFRQLDMFIDDMAVDRLLDTIDEALAARLIEEAEDASDRYRFTHHLIQQTLLNELSTTRRVRTHGRIAEGLNKLYAGDIESHSAELAFHFREAEAALGAEKVVKYSLIAGERAIARLAYRDALTYFQRALASKLGRTGMEHGAVVAHDAEMAAILFGLGRAQAATAQRHQMQEAVASLVHAFDYYVKAGDIEHAVRVAQYPVIPITGVTGLSSLIERVLGLVPPDSHESGRLRSRQVRVLGLEMGDYAGAMESFDRAIAIARRENDTALQIQALAEAASVDGYHLRLHDALQKSMAAMEPARDADEPHAMFVAHNWAASVLMAMGEVDRARSYAQESLAIAGRLHDSHRISGSLDTLACLARLEGKLDIARAYNDRGLSETPTDARLLAFRAMVEFETGNTQAAEPYLGKLLSSARASRPGPIFLNAYVAMVAPLVARKAPERSSQLAGVARTAIDAVLSSHVATPSVLLFAHIGKGLLAVEAGDAVEARRQYSAIEPHKGTFVYGGLTTVDRILGLLAAAGGNTQLALRHFNDSAALCVRAGHFAGKARALVDTAEAELAMGRSGERADAASTLEEALDLAGRLGLRPMQDRISALKERYGVRRPAPSEFPNGLTAREVEVLRCVAEGKSNPEIARELYISLNTVTRHVSHIFQKTGATNRAEAAVYATGHNFA